jgi:hypothetical protein
MGKGIHLLLKFFYSGIQTSYHFIFALKLPFLLFEGLYLNFFSLDFTFKFRNLSVLLLGNSLDGIFLFFGDSFDDIFFVGLKYIFDLREVGFNNLSHPAEALKQRGNFLLQGCTEDTRDIWLHHPDDALDFFLVRGVLRYEGALELHNCLNDELELINFGFLLIWYDFIIFEDLGDYCVELRERAREPGFNIRNIHNARLQKILH